MDASRQAWDLLQGVRLNGGSLYVDDMDETYSEAAISHALHEGWLKLDKGSAWDAGIWLYTPEAYEARYPTSSFATFVNRATAAAKSYFKARSL